MRRVTIIGLLVAVNMLVCVDARPGFFYGIPLASSQTSVVRDLLGNQATSYAYQDGHSSAVSVSRKDVSKGLAIVPALAPAIAPLYQEPVIAAAPAPYVAPAPAIYSSPLYYY